MEKIDLHIHSTLSDGDLNIEEIIKIAKSNNCNKIAITDHEVIRDYTKKIQEYKINIINGIEFNTSIRGMHILGYGIIDMEQVKSFIYKLHKENEAISYQLIKKLSHRGFNISEELIDEYLGLKGIKYDFLDKRHIVKYLIDKGYTKDVPETYNKLIGRGTDLYIPLKKISPIEILNLINNSGGVSILAHPETLGLSNYELLLEIKKLIHNGLDGIEIINNQTSNSNKDYYQQIANELDIISTVGSDFHSYPKQNIGIECSEKIYNSLVKKISYKNSFLRK